MYQSFRGSLGVNHWCHSKDSALFLWTSLKFEEFQLISGFFWVGNVFVCRTSCFAFRFSFNSMSYCISSTVVLNRNVVRNPSLDLTCLANDPFIHHLMHLQTLAFHHKKDGVFPNVTILSSLSIKPSRKLPNVVIFQQTSRNSSRFVHVCATISSFHRFIRVLFFHPPFLRCI